MLQGLQSWAHCSFVMSNIQETPKALSTHHCLEKAVRTRLIAGSNSNNDKDVTMGNL